MRWNKTLLTLGAAGLAMAALVGCGGSSSTSNGGTGTLSLSLTDAPLVDDANVSGVYITIARIEYHTSGGGWQTMKDFNTSVNPINLLEWQEGKSISLGDFRLPAGKYTQMRFVLDAAAENEMPRSNTGCFITINDVNHTLYVPSGTQTGYKAIGNYDVPVNGDVNMTADFDVRKSVTVAGGGSYYMLKPTIRLVVTNQAGDIKGTLSNFDVNSSYVIYAYEYVNGNTTWNTSEEDSFANAVTSAAVHPDGNYTIPYLAAGTYDLVIAQYDTNGTYVGYTAPVGTVDVTSGETTTYDRGL